MRLFKIALLVMKTTRFGDNGDNDETSDIITARVHLEDLQRDSIRFRIPKVITVLFLSLS